jgi:signal peptidase II
MINFDKLKQVPLIKYYSAFLLAIGVLIIDQNIKYLFVSGYRFETECISGVLTYNKGVAFSMFTFLGEYLKYIQIIFLITVVGFILFSEDGKKLILPVGLLFGAGISNILDRFTYGGVVDYVYWHCGFDFAIFNFADVMIDLGVVIMLYIVIKESRKKTEKQDS